MKDILFLTMLLPGFIHFLKLHTSPMDLFNQNFMDTTLLILMSTECHKPRKETLHIELLA